MAAYPDDLPWILEYRVGSTVRTTLPRRSVAYVASSGVTDAPIVCPQIPVGCSGWRRACETARGPVVPPGEDPRALAETIAKRGRGEAGSEEPPPPGQATTLGQFISKLRFPCPPI
jgi:hypothetical protein